MNRIKLITGETLVDDRGCAYVEDAGPLRLIARDPVTGKLVSVVSDDLGATWCRVDGEPGWTVRTPIGDDPRQWDDRCWQNWTPE